MTTQRQCASQVILSSVLQYTWQAIALPVCAAGFHLTDRNASQSPEACCLSCLFLKLLIDTHETLQDCKLFTGVRNYTSGYTQFLPWFLHPKTSWTCQMYLLMVQTEQWPANRPWSQQHVLILWATVAQPKHAQTARNCKLQIAALEMGTDQGTLSSIVLCCTDIKGVQLVSLTTSLHNKYLRETTASRNLFNPARQNREVLNC